MFHSRIGAPREMQRGLTQCDSVWCGHPHALVTTVLCHTPNGAFGAALTFWALRATSSRDGARSELQRNPDANHHSCLLIKCAYRNLEASFKII